MIVLTEEHFLLVDAQTRDVVNEYDSTELFNIKKKNNTTLSLFTARVSFIVTNFYIGG